MADGKEVVYEENVQLVSTTDTDSIITYANQDFCDIAGYTQDELVGNPHNMVRHPDMPKEAFANMWADLKANNAWRGLVKNRCKNGDYYWVDAYVTAIYENGKKVGYQSVRVKPTREQIKKATELYQQINKGKIKSLLKSKSIISNFLMQYAGLSLAINLGLFFSGLNDITTLATIILIQIIVLIPMLPIIKKLKLLQKNSLSINKNPLIQKVFAKSMDEVGSVESSLSMLNAQNRTLLGRLDDYSRLIKNSVSSTKNAIEESNTSFHNIGLQVDMVSSAVTESASATEEISRSISATSKVSKESNNTVTESIANIKNVTTGISKLTHDMSDTAEKTELLQANTNEIESTLSIISQIAEQTNLLALNAAIEAARAGEQGRGFAVVADEVRNLASKTQASTEEIHTAIAQVQSAVKQTVDNIMKNQKDLAELSSYIENTVTAFNRISEMMVEVSDRSMHVASAAEEQSAVAIEIQNNVLTIQENVDKNKITSRKTENECKVLDKLAANLDSITTAFK